MFSYKFYFKWSKDSLNVKKIEDGALSAINSNNNRSRFGKLFVEKLGQIQDINLELKKQQENSAKLKKNSLYIFYIIHKNKILIFILLKINNN